MNIIISLNHPYKSYDDKKGVIFWFIEKDTIVDEGTSKALWRLYLYFYLSFIALCL